MGWTEQDYSPPESTEVQPDHVEEEIRTPVIHIPITDLFNVYNLQINPQDEDKICSQDVVNYCEAQF